MDLLLLATFCVALLSSILSGLASGGGGFIMGPWWLIIGLSPAQAIACGSFTGIGMAFSSLHAMRQGGVRTRKRIAIVASAIAAISALIASRLLPHMNVEIFSILIAMVTLGSLPLFFSRHKRFTQGTRSHRSELYGYITITGLLLAGSVLFSSGLAMLVALALPFFFGTSTLESTAIRRTVSLVQMTVLLVAMYSFIALPYAIAGLIGGAIGSYIGTHIAIKRGDRFAKNALGIGAVLSVLLLLIR